MRNLLFSIIILAVAAGAACQRSAADPANGAGMGAAGSPKGASPTPFVPNAVPDNFTAADIAKLKWLEGTWRGMHEDKPFIERYRFEETAMIVETLSPGDTSKVEDTSRFELTNGEFGHTKGNRRSVATEITDDHVQFVPVSGGGNSFRFERQPDGWRAVLEWVGQDNEPKQKVYKMEPYKK